MLHRGVPHPWLTRKGAFGHGLGYSVASGSRGELRSAFRVMDGFCECLCFFSLLGHLELRNKAAGLVESPSKSELGHCQISRIYVDLLERRS